MKLVAIRSYLFLSLMGILSFVYPVFAVNISGKPAYPEENNPRSASIFIHALEPGQTAQDGVLITNLTDERKEVWVYTQDYRSASDGAFACKQMTEAKTAVGNWLSVTTSEILLAPKESKIVPFTISVPKDASVGEHNGCVLIQEKKESEDIGAGISLSFRSAIRVAVTIPGTIHKELHISTFEVVPGDETLFVAAAKNTGNVSLDAQVIVIEENIFGKKIAEYGGEYPVLRDQTATWNFKQQPNFWGGLHKAYVTLSFNNSPNQSLGEMSDNNIATLQSNIIWFFVSPSIRAYVIYGVIVFLFLCIVSIVLVKKHQKRLIKQQWKVIVIRRHQSLKHVADRYGISWKLLAKVNGKKPPYDISEGEKLKVPSQK